MWDREAVLWAGENVSAEHWGGRDAEAEMSML